MNKNAISTQKRAGKSSKRHMNEKDLRKILEIIDIWEGVLKWDTLIAKIEQVTGRAWTRQGLSNQERIRLAFQVRKQIDRSHAAKQIKGSKGDRADATRLRELQVTISRLERENNALLAQFQRWAHNAHKRGLSEAELNAALPSVDREPTRLEPRRIKRGITRSNDRD
jgi:hypothetical protein